VRITLRAAQPADAPTIVDFNRLLALETEHKQLDPAVLEAGVTAVLADPSRGRYFVAEEDGLILGQLMVTTEWSDWRNGWIWWIQSVYVRHTARRRGIFRSLYRHVHETAQADPAVIGLRLYVERDNARAQQTYQSMGMEATSYFVFERCPL
jgi:ribosomal protein S18 acetylase RimI-like enzyme